MMKLATSKQRVVLGLQQENDRLRAELLDAAQTMTSAMDNAQAERVAADLAKTRIRELEELVSIAQHEAHQRPHTATLDRCRAALTEQRQWAVGEHIKFQDRLRNQAARIRQLTDPARTASIAAGGAAFGFALAHVWGWL